MAFNKTDRPDGAKMRRPGGMRRRKKVCAFRMTRTKAIDHNRHQQTRMHLRDKILPRRITINYMQSTESFNCSYQAPLSPHRNLATCMRTIFD